MQTQQSVTTNLLNNFCLYVLLYKHIVLLCDDKQSTVQYSYNFDYTPPQNFLLDILYKYNNF